MRALALIALATTCVATPVIAFDANRVAQATWGAFKTVCGQAVTDLKGYIKAARASRLRPRLWGLRTDMSWTNAHSQRSLPVLVGMAVVVLSAPATAQMPQPAQIDAAQGLALFEDRCRMALFDPNAYVASVPPTLPVGGSAFAQSPDQQILSAHEFHNPWFVEFYISSTGTHRMIRCSAHGWSDFGESYGLANADALAQQLQAALAGRADGALVGGLMPQNYAQIYGGQAAGVPETNQYYFSASFDWGEEYVPVWVDVHVGGLSLTTVRIEESAQ